MIVCVDRNGDMWSYKCEYCGQKHYHGVTPMDSDGFTHRVSDCIATRHLIHGYLLTEDKTKANMPTYFSIIDEHVKLANIRLRYQEKYNVIQKCLHMEYKEFKSLMTITTKDDCEKFCEQMSEKYKHYTFKVKKLGSRTNFYIIDLKPLSYE